MTVKNIASHKPDVLVKIEELLVRAAAAHADKANTGTSYSIGHPYHRAVTGDVRMRSDFVTYDYNMPTAWDAALEIGNNIKDGSALDLARKVYADILEAIDDGDVVVTKRGEGAVIKDGGNEIYLRCEYASSYCWVGAKVRAVELAADVESDNRPTRSMRPGR